MKELAKDIRAILAQHGIPVLGSPEAAEAADRAGQYRIKLLIRPFEAPRAPAGLGWAVEAVGDTYPLREDLKEAGWRWEAGARRWVVEFGAGVEPIDPYLQAVEAALWVRVLEFRGGEVK